jgi:RsiW-degrading membrane proteinase PrsW (M82 family)
MLVALSVLFAVVPMLSLLWLVWWLDRYDREPVRLVVATFLWGATGAVALGLLSASALRLVFVPEADVLSFVPVAVLGPISEEVAKAAIFLWLLRSRHFDNATDGFVYGAASGLGFAMTENALYFSTVGAAAPEFFATVVVGRTLFSAGGHLCATSVFGAIVGHVRFRPLMARRVATVAALALASLAHGTFNALALYDKAFFLLIPLEYTVVFAVFWGGLRAERHQLRRELDGEASDGLIPRSHISVLCSYRRRSKAGWLGVGIDRERYVIACSRLAMRKHQLRYADDRWRSRYAFEASALRAEIREMLESTADDTR